MGNILRKKRVVTEELESLSSEMKAFRSDIESTFNRRKNVLSYVTLLIFVLVTSLSAYIIAVFPKREHQIVFVIGCFLAGSALLYLLRKLINAYYNYIVARKQKSLDEAIKRKKKILDDVKETETFKVAKEILDKYDDQKPGDSQKPPPSEPNRNLDVKPVHSSRGPDGKRAIPTSSAPVSRSAIGPGPRATAGMGNFSTSSPQNPPPRLLGPPPRPFVKESKTTVDKVVDYFFGDGPNNRYALICCNCNGHNGMAFPGEFEYLAFMCYICGQFNPAKKLRPNMQRPSLAAGELRRITLRAQPDSPGGPGERPPSVSSQAESVVERNDSQTDDDDFVAVDREFLPSSSS